MKPVIRVIVCRMNAEPVVEEIEDGVEIMQAIVGGYIQAIPVGGSPVGRGVDVWCNEDSLDMELPANRLLRLPGGTIGIAGHFLVCAHDEEVSVSLTDEEIAAWLPFLQRAPVGTAAHPEVKA